MVLTLFIILIGGLALGVPIAVALGFATIFPGLTNPAFPFAGLCHPEYSECARQHANAGHPSFILSGNIMTKGKISE